MFDPFRDFATAGYLRNRSGEKDQQIIKHVEHGVFTRNLDRAMKYLAGRERIAYDDFRAVHRILFLEFYPWAGIDRSQTAPGLAISKGNTKFCAPADISRAIDEGLRLAQVPGKMRAYPGKVMGYFAYGHPFLDGNGRTMLLVHCELSFRAGFSIDWSATRKADYLQALSADIEDPGAGHLDRYLSGFLREQPHRPDWEAVVSTIDGLDGADALDEDSNVDGDLGDPVVAVAYREFSERRNKSYQVHDAEALVCRACKSAPCTCSEPQPQGGL